MEGEWRPSAVATSQENVRSAATSRSIYKYDCEAGSTVGTNTYLLALVNFHPLVEYTNGWPEIVVGRLDGPVATGLHLIRSRLSSWHREAARRGELRANLAIGYEHDLQGKIIVTPDQAIRESRPRLP